MERLEYHHRLNAEARGFIERETTDGSDADDDAPVPSSPQKIYVCVLFTERIEDGMRNVLRPTALKVVTEDC